MASIHIIRHGQSLHNVQRGYPGRDPPLTEKGRDDAKLIKISTKTGGEQELPDLILISPMTRAIQTAILAFPSIFQSHNPLEAEVQIWPELREAHDAECNKGSSQADLMREYPGLDFSRLPLQWDYPPHTSESATVCAEDFRKKLHILATSGKYRNIAVITHRGFIAFLVSGKRFEVCEVRSYRFTTEDEAVDGGIRFGTNVDTEDPQDFGPTLLVPVEFA